MWRSRGSTVSVRESGVIRTRLTRQWRSGRSVVSRSRRCDIHPMSGRSVVAWSRRCDIHPMSGRSVVARSRRCHMHAHESVDVNGAYRVTSSRTRSGRSRCVVTVIVPSEVTSVQIRLTSSVGFSPRSACTDGGAVVITKLCTRVVLGGAQRHAEQDAEEQHRNAK